MLTSLKHALRSRLDRFLIKTTARIANGIPLDELAAFEARWSSARFIGSHLSRATPFSGRHELLSAATENAKNDGLWAEFGVFRGETLRALCKQRPTETIHGFDSFQGLPSNWRAGFPAGTFAVAQASLGSLPSNCRLWPGWFSDSLPQFLESYPEPAAFLHIDCDLYSSTVDVLNAIGDRIRPGTVLVFDEFFNHTGWEAGEFRAWSEFVGRRNLKFEYLGYCRHGEQVSLMVCA